MRRFPSILLSIGLAAFNAPAHAADALPAAVSPADTSAARTAILAQIKAFAADDATRAFSFATLLPRIDVAKLRCESHYLDRHSGRRLPEMDGFGWFALARVDALCTPKMAAVLNVQVGLEGVLARLAQEVAPTEPNSALV